MRTINQVKQAEHDRLAFIEVRDGAEKMIEFAKQTYKVYRLCRRGKTGMPTPYGKAYRNELIVSCVVLRQVLRQNDKD